MIALLTNILPIALGFFAKLLALKSQASSDLQKLQLEALVARQQVVDSARANERTESPWSALNRRVIIFVILGLVIFTQIAPVFLNVNTVIPTVREGFSLLGVQITADEIEYVTVKGMLKLDEVFSWATLIVEVYFGSTMAKAR
jgi:hypothetical protein